VEIEGRHGKREVAVEALHRLPGDTPERESVLEPGDLIVALRLPGEARAFSAHARYLKVRERTAFAFAVVSAAAALRIEQGTIRDARLALGGVAAKPWRARAAEEMLAASSPGPDAFHRAAKAALADAKPSGDNQFKIELAQRILVRALTLAAAGTPRRIPALPASPFSSVSGALHDA
jgi:xanthine dehydrogenase YagS FAD-binding subunit